MGFFEECRAELSSVTYCESLCLYFFYLLYKKEYVISDKCGISIAIPENYKDKGIWETCFKQSQIINLNLSVTRLGFFCLTFFFGGF